MSEISKEMIEAVTAALLNHGDFGHSDETNRANAEKAARAVVALIRPAIGEGSRVKPLEWHTTEDVTQNTTGVCAYKIEHWEGGDFGVYLHGYVALHSNPFTTLDEAKSAAQADYEQRILSALRSPPEPVSVVEGGAIAALDDAMRAMNRCEHDGGFDREIGPIGCFLRDKCVCIGVLPLVAKARESLTPPMPAPPERRKAPEPVAWTQPAQLELISDDPTQGGGYIWGKRDMAEVRRKFPDIDFHDDVPLYASAPSDGELMRMLTEALEPFAKFDTEDFPDEMRAFEDDPTLLMKHFRRARAALSAKDAE